jgi:HAD superfamily hydrolase (TIGR01509 family)
MRRDKAANPILCVDATAEPAAGSQVRLAIARASFLLPRVNLLTRAVIFDVDGTLIDSNELHVAAWVRTFRHFGFDVASEAVRPHIGKGGDQLMPVFLPSEVVIGRGEEIAAFRTELFIREYAGKARPFPSVRALLERLREAGQRIVLATSSKAEELERSLETAGIGDLIDGATSSNDAERSKPAPDIFAAALRRLAPIVAAQAVVVGDTPYDAEAATKLGLQTIGLLCGGFPEIWLRDAGCIAVYRDPAHLLAAFEISPLAAS